MPRSRPSKSFETREAHRMALVLHALAMIFGLALCAWQNRVRSPDVLWVQWVALGWGIVFLGHLWLFSRGTLATMGEGRKR
jgi:hypothetical protein